MGINHWELYPQNMVGDAVSGMKTCMIGDPQCVLQLQPLYQALWNLSWKLQLNGQAALSGQIYVRSCTIEAQCAGNVRALPHLQMCTCI
eukprot:1159865-Pelagomonas_calceolata.AAC.9